MSMTPGPFALALLAAPVSADAVTASRAVGGVALGARVGVHQVVAPSSFSSTSLAQPFRERAALFSRPFSRRIMTESL